MNAESIFEERWDELAQAQFWQKIMLLSPDSCIVNVAATRQILSVIPVRQWARQTEIEKAAYKVSIKAANGIGSEEEIYVTTGKSDFYKSQ